MGVRLVELRTYRLKPGTRDRFHALFAGRAIPLVRGVMDVLAFGPSAHDVDGYFLIRVFDDLAHRQRAQDSFYGSDAWRNGPREEILALIADYLDAVFELDEAGIAALRRREPDPTPVDRTRSG